MTPEAVGGAAIGTAALAMAWTAALWLLRGDKPDRPERDPICPDCKRPNCRFAEAGALHPQENR